MAIEIKRQAVTTVRAAQNWMGSAPDIGVFLAFAEKLQEAVDAGVTTNHHVRVEKSGFYLNASLTQDIP